MVEKIPDGFKNAIIVILSALLGSGGGVWGYMQIDPPREYPYTSINAEKDFSDLRDEIMGLRALLEQQTQNIHDIVVEMAKLPPDEFEKEVRKNTEFRIRHELRNDLHGP